MHINLIINLQLCLRLMDIFAKERA